MGQFTDGPDGSWVTKCDPSSALGVGNVYPHVCLYVFLSVRISQKQHTKIHVLFNTYYLWPWLGPPLTTVE